MMARIGKCRACKGDWVTLVSYASVEHSCDAIGCCRTCMTEHRLEFAHAHSINYVIMEDWVVGAETPQSEPEEGP